MNSTLNAEAADGSLQSKCGRDRPNRLCVNPHFGAVTWDRLQLLCLSVLECPHLNNAYPRRATTGPPQGLNSTETEDARPTAWQANNKV